MLWVAALIVSSAFGSQTTMSASLPGAIVPFFGYIPKMRAGAVAVISTNRFSDSLPELTP